MNLFNIIIASPSSKFVNQSLYQLQKIRENQIPIEIGDVAFELNEIRIISNQSLNFPLRVITGSPILIRIPIEKFKEQSNEHMPYQSIYWRSSHPLQLFIESLEQNLRKKYMEFTGSEPRNERLFESFKFKKQVSTRLQVGNSKTPLIGSLWEFVFSQCLEKEIQLFALDCGLGERNSLGFGFINPILRKID